MPSVSGGEGEAAPVASSADVGASEADATSLVVEGETTKDVFGVGRSVVVRGTVRHGVMAFGGDVVIEGRVEGDVGAIGGSVTQRAGSYIGGDVLVIGGAYHHGKDAPGRDPASKTVMVAGYEQELRALARNPLSLLEPSWTPAFLGQRLLSVFFWFVVSWALTAATPGLISRAAARLQLTSLRIAVIGFLGAVVIWIGPVVALKFLPPVLSVLVGTTALLLLLVSYLFGRVVIHAATGRWLQRLAFPAGQRSESTALLLGALFWALVLSLPYLWPLVVAGLLVTSLGLALTARSRLGWKQPAKL